MPARPTAEQWAQLSRTHTAALVSEVRPLLDGDGRVELDADRVARMSSSSVGEAKDLLDELVRMDVFAVDERTRCGCCQEPLTEEEEAEEELCPHCEQPLADCEVRRANVYVRSAERGRDVRWMLVVHGMNTRGEWQERFSWLCSTTHQRSLPVFIYKYGKVRPGVLLRWRQRQLADQLAKRIDLLNEEYGLGDNGPDVIAHSFGTWLIGHVLLENPSLRIGRLILAGSILRPDFPLGSLIDRGQVDAVLNHCAGNDRWVPLAHVLVPEAGPSGKKGFIEEAVIHRQEDRFGHSSFFENDLMEENYQDVWDVFLRRPRERLDELGLEERVRAWRETPTPLRKMARLVVLLIVAIAASVLCLSSVVGFTEMAGWL